MTAASTLVSAPQSGRESQHIPAFTTGRIVWLKMRYERMHRYESEDDLDHPIRKELKVVSALAEVDGAERAIRYRLLMVDGVEVEIWQSDLDAKEDGPVGMWGFPDVDPQQPKFHVGQSVWIKPQGQRPFSFLGDEDPESAVHGELLIAGIDAKPKGEREPFEYRLVERAGARMVFFAPESGLLEQVPAQ